MKLPEEIEFLQNARKPQLTTDAPLDGRHVIITGATAGIGLETARRFAREGAELTLVCRNPEKADRVAEELSPICGTSVTIVIADLSRLLDVRAAAETILATGRPIHILVSNAGLHSTTRELTADGNELVYGVNHLAAFLLTRLLLERIRESAPARIIFVNSQGHRFGGLDLDDVRWDTRRYRGMKGYGASKTAQLLTVPILAKLLGADGVTVNAMHPGAVRSQIGMNNGLIYRLYSKAFVSLFLKDTSLASNALHYLAAAPEMATVTGKYFNLTIEETPARHARDSELGKLVWRASEEACGLPPMEIG